MNESRQETRPHLLHVMKTPSSASTTGVALCVMTGMTQQILHPHPHSLEEHTMLASS